MHTGVSSLPKGSSYTSLQVHSCADGQPLSFLCPLAASNGFSDQYLSMSKEYLARVQLSSHGSQRSPGQGAVTPRRAEPTPCSTSTSIQDAEYRLAQLTCGQESITLQSCVLKVKVLGTQAGNWPLPASWLCGGGDGTGKTWRRGAWENQNIIAPFLSFHFLSAKGLRSKGSLVRRKDRGNLTLFLQQRIWTYRSSRVPIPIWLKTKSEHPNYWPIVNWKLQIWSWMFFNCFSFHSVFKKVRISCQCLKRR